MLVSPWGSVIISASSTHNMTRQDTQGYHPNNIQHPLSMIIHLASRLSVPDSEHKLLAHPPAGTAPSVRHATPTHQLARSRKRQTPCPKPWLLQSSDRFFSKSLELFSCLANEHHHTRKYVMNFTARSFLTGSWLLCWDTNAFISILFGLETIGKFGS